MIPWTRICYKCKQIKSMFGGTLWRRKWVCAECKSALSGGNNG